MTKFENDLFDFNESMFGTAFAVKVYCTCSDAFTAFCYMMYLTTLPFKFVSLFIKNFKQKMESN